LVAWVLLQHENEVQDKHVESVWFPCLDEGSTPSSSTIIKFAASFYNMSMINRIKQWLQTLSFRTGVIVLLCCIPFYILSFAQMLLPISAAAKGVLWTVLFGMAKTCQYGGLTILGVEGYQRLKSWFKRKRG